MLSVFDMLSVFNMLSVFDIMFLPYLRNADIETIIGCMIDADETRLIWKKHVIQVSQYLFLTKLLSK